MKLCAQRTARGRSSACTDPTVWPSRDDRMCGFVHEEVGELQLGIAKRVGTLHCVTPSSSESVGRLHIWSTFPPVGVPCSSRRGKRNGEDELRHPLRPLTLPERKLADAEAESDHPKQRSRERDVVQEGGHRAWSSRRRSPVVGGLSMPPRHPTPAWLGLTALLPVAYN